MCFSWVFSFLCRIHCHLSIQPKVPGFWFLLKALFLQFNFLLKLAPNLAIPHSLDTIWVLWKLHCLSSSFRTFSIFLKHFSLNGHNLWKLHWSVNFLNCLLLLPLSFTPTSTSRQHGNIFLFQKRQKWSKLINEIGVLCQIAFKGEADQTRPNKSTLIWGVCVLIGQFQCWLEGLRNFTREHRTQNTEHCQRQNVPSQLLL